MANLTRSNTSAHPRAECKKFHAQDFLFTVREPSTTDPTPKTLVACDSVLRARPAGPPAVGGASVEPKVPRSAGATHARLLDRPPRRRRRTKPSTRANASDFRQSRDRLIVRARESNAGFSTTRCVRSTLDAREGSSEIIDVARPSRRDGNARARAPGARFRAKSRCGFGGLDARGRSMARTKRARATSPARGAARARARWWMG